MKTKTGKTSRFLAMILSFVLITGFCFSGPAAREIRSGKRQDNTQRTQADTTGTVSPSPVVDDSPINPDTAGNKKANDTLKRQKNSKQDSRKVQKKSNPFRLW